VGQASRCAPSFTAASRPAIDELTSFELDSTARCRADGLQPGGGAEHLAVRDGR